MTYTYKTKGVCSSTINFQLENGIVSDVSFIGGCNGNLRAIGRLVEGMEAKKLITVLKGNTCGFKSTSCADQLALAIEKALSEQDGENQ